ncbi:urea carboxylase-associated family protein [Mycolicibacterium baixiangningiae]|uniref:urea carboxylase-associated family protein n=1 Tax=Mycolicibacterium baixiangningiae TaxID=2761578 RepID=UPI00299F8372|nr:urea carboxylase-associated family protein [Mycolicibacterium baixiangningiae]
MVPAGTGWAVTLRRGDRIRVIDVEGGQVGDVFAFVADDPAEHLSASHTRTATSRLFPAVGEHFVTNQRRPILAFVEDTSPGIHDMLIAACDAERYRGYGLTGHPSCADNLRKALETLQIELSEVPQPVNIFMNIPVGNGGALAWLPAATKPGDAVVFEAALDCAVVVSACPMDLNGINGQKPTQLAIETAAPAAGPSGGGIV